LPVFPAHSENLHRPGGQDGLHRHPNLGGLALAKLEWHDEGDLTLKQGGEMAVGVSLEVAVCACGEEVRVEEKNGIAENGGTGVDAKPRDVVPDTLNAAALQTEDAVSLGA
jgi:hypothetical protein